MALKDNEMQLVSILGAGVLTAALFLPVVVFAKSGTQKPADENLVAIEASIAYSKTPQKQPQKKFKQPDEVKPEGVTHDEKQKPEEQKKKEPDKKPDLSDITKFHHGDDDDEPVGKPTTDPGKFNGDENGYAEETKGDQWVGKLAEDMHFSLPGISKVSDVPVGCIHLTPDGKIVDTKWIHQSAEDVQNAADESLKRLVTTRNANPVPVPTYLLSLTTKWLCFKFSVQSP